jgi:ABC-type Fe3+-hydroxamate transport system substrate-binding protein
MRYPEVSWGDVEAAQPDVILLPDGSNGFTEADRSEAAVLDVPAARHHRVHLIDQRLLTWYGIRLAFALEQIPPLFGQGMLASEENETSGV